MGEFDYNKSVILGLNSITRYRTFFSIIEGENKIG